MKLGKDCPVLGIDEIGRKPIQIKNANIEIQSTGHPNKTLKKKLREIRTFKEIGIFPSGLSFNEKCVKSSFTDRHGNVNENYSVGVRFPCNNYEYYIKTAGKGCGVSVSHANNEKEVFSRVEVINGICLYGGEKFLLKTRKGNPVSLTELNFQVNEAIYDISVDESFSVYEIDAVIGLSSFINILVEWNENIDTIHIEIPKGQYYLFLADVYEKGYLSPELFQKCISEIDKRHETIFQAYKKRLTLRNINKIEPLALIEDYFSETLEKRKDICIEKARQILSQDETWRQILSVQRPEKWKELSYLSHIVVFLKVGEKESGKAVLQVDDPIEEKIRMETSKVINKLGEKNNYRIWGIYPLQKVFLNPKYCRNSDLYYCPNIKLNISMIKKIIAQYKYKGNL